MKKFLSIGILYLIIGTIAVPLCVSTSMFDDTTPPVTSHSLNPQYPDGENGYYIGNVTVFLNATDDLSGVKEIKYRINEYVWYTITGDDGFFIANQEGNDILIEYYAIDNANNEESIKSFTLDIDKTPPIDIQVELGFYREGGFYYLDISIKGKDTIAGMDRIEIYINNGLQEIIEGSGPDYVFTIQWVDDIIRHTLMIYLYDRAGNVKVVTINFCKAFLFGRIENLTINNLMITFNAIRVFVIQRSPFNYYIYSSGEKIHIFRPRLEFFTSKFLSGFFIMAKISIHTEPPFNY
jgi:hypothetical protein